MIATYISSSSFYVEGNKESEFIVGRRLKLDCVTDGYVYATVSGSLYSDPNTIVNIEEGSITNNLVGVLYGIVSTGQVGSLPNHNHNGLEGSGGIITETDPVFVASSAYGITNPDIINWDTAYAWGDHSNMGYLTEFTAYSGSGVSSFLELTDTPSTYSGTEGKYLRSTGSGTEWSEVQSSSVGSFLDLDDTPTTYSGTEGMYLVSNGSGIGWALADAYGVVGSTFSTGIGSPDVQSSDYYIDKNSDCIYEKTVEGRISDNLGVLLIHSDTTDGSTTFVDSSPTGNIITPRGGVHHEVDRNRFGATSIYFDGSGDYLSIPDNEGFYFNADFTMECWVYPETVDTSYCLMCQYSNNTNRMLWNLASTGNMEFWLMGVTYASPAHNIVANTWNHVALARHGNTLYHFVNGILIGTNDFNVIYPNMGTFYIGTRLYSGSPGLYLSGYLDEIRIVKGEALWIDNFTLATEPYAPAGASVWESVLETPKNFIDLNDTPTTYSGIEGNYLRVTASGIEAINGIILIAPNASEWLLQVTNSGTLYTTSI